MTAQSSAGLFASPHMLISCCTGTTKTAHALRHFISWIHPKVHVHDIDETSTAPVYQVSYYAGKAEISSSPCLLHFSHVQVHDALLVTSPYVHVHLLMAGFLQYVFTRHCLQIYAAVVQATLLRSTTVWFAGWFVIRHCTANHFEPCNCCCTCTRRNKIFSCMTHCEAQKVQDRLGYVLQSL